MAAPTSADIRSWSKVDFADLGYPAPTPPAADPLDILLLRSTQFVEWATGQTFGGMPTTLAAVANQAVQVMVEMFAYQAQPDVVETIADFALISSFSAGEYSETRRSLSEVKDAGAFSWLFSNPLLWALLWSLMTDDMRDEWNSWITGVNAPAFAVTEVDWQGTFPDRADFGLRGSLPYDPMPPMTD